MKYQITRHIRSGADELRHDEVLLENLYHGTRMLTNDEVWPVLAKYEEPTELGDSPLEVRAAQAKLIEPVGEKMEPNFVVSDFDEISNKVLSYRKVKPHEDLYTRLDQISLSCRPMSMAKPREYGVWHDPVKIFEIVLDHFRLYMDLEVGNTSTAKIGSDFIRKATHRPPRQEALEQQVTSLHTSWIRAQRMTEMVNPGDKILILGDDDLVSLALEEFPVERIDVLEYDSQLVRMLKKQSGEKVHIKRADLSKGLPRDYHDKYDLVISDPMYAEDGMEFFLACAAQALNPETESRFLLSTYPPLLENTKYFPTQVARNGLTVLETIEHYNRYPFPEDMREGGLHGLLTQGYHPKLAQAIISFPYLYAHLYVCERTKHYNG